MKQKRVKEHDWTPPGSHPVSGHRGNVWSCRRCGAVITWNGWPDSPINDPNYEIPPPPWKNSYPGGSGETKIASYLGNQLRDCDEEIARKITES